MLKEQRVEQPHDQQQNYHFANDDKIPNLFLFLLAAAAAGVLKKYFTQKVDDIEK